MNYISYNKCDVMNGEGIRCVLWCSGCNHKCIGCFSKESWKFCNGISFNTEMQNKVIEDLSPDYISGLTLSGGDSLHPRNAIDLITFIKRLKEDLPTKTIWCYTGYRFEELLNNQIQRDFLGYVDILVDGKFQQELYEPDLLFRGSANQRIILVQESLASNKIVLYNNGNYK